jgi:hypothetical protein
MEEQAEFRDPVFGGGAPKTNETRIGITTPARGRQDAPAACRRARFESYAYMACDGRRSAGLAGKSRGGFRLAPIVICSPKTQGFSSKTHPSFSS